MQMCNVWSESLTQVNLLSLFINMNKFLVLACVVGVALAMPGGKGGSKGGKARVEREREANLAILQVGMVEME